MEIDLNDPRLQPEARVCFKPNTWVPITNFEVEVSGLVGKVTAAIHNMEIVINVRLELTGQEYSLDRKKTIKDLLEPWDGDVVFDNMGGDEEIERFFDSTELFTGPTPAYEGPTAPLPPKWYLTPVTIWVETKADSPEDARENVEALLEKRICQHAEWGQFTSVRNVYDLGETELDGDEETACEACGKTNHGTADHADSCPTCGCLPGDDITAGCTDPDGCGYLTSEEAKKDTAGLVCPDCDQPFHGDTPCPVADNAPPTSQRITLKAEPQEGGCPCHGMDNCPDRSGL